MKKIFFLLISTFIWACSQNDCENNLFITKEFKVDKEVCINGNYYFNINEIVDARCPKDVECLWEGDVALIMSTYPKTGDGPAKSDTIRVLESENSKVFDLFDLYKVKVESISPSPRKDVIISQSEYIVKMTVSEK